MRTAVVKPSFAPSMKASYTFTRFLMPANIKPTMTHISSMLAAKVLTTFIRSLSIEPNSHITAATARLIPPSVSSIVRFSRLMRWYRLVTITPARVEKNVAISMGMNTSVGCAAPICAR